MGITKTFVVGTAILSTTFLGIYSQHSVNVDINLNMKHSVDGVSDFGRERHMTIHATPFESDWNGEEDKLDYLINDLGVYFGRETGSATWKMQGVEEDPERPNRANEAQMVEHSNGLKQWESSDLFINRRQYQGKRDNMIMGINDTSPMYPNLSWFPGFGKGKDGWFVKDVEGAAEWVSLYLDHYFAKSSGDLGFALPKYWECYNEPDMNFMNPSFGMIVSSLEQNWEYHKQVAQSVRARLGDKAPLIGGMTQGQHDFFKPDGVPSRSDGQFWYDNSSEEAGLLYDNMLSGVNGWPKAWDKRKDKWWQWDYLWQGFIDHAGEDMDFYGVHIYDWPAATKQRSTIRSGGHTEAMLDQLEWYDNFKFGKKKDIVLSEFGAVARNYILSLPARRRDWEFIKPFNQMFMEFLERPSHVIMSMPFAPTKAVWGAVPLNNGEVERYDGATLFDPLGEWTGSTSPWTINEPSEGWDWSAIIYYFELWKDVDGTRIDTKASSLDVQVDAYVKGNHVYVILNNADDGVENINLNTFNTAANNRVANVEMRHLFFNPDLGTEGEPDLSVVQLDSAPSQVTLKPNSTIVLDYTYENPVTIDKESKEIKYMSEPLTNAKNTRGTQLCRLEGQNNFTTTIKNVVKPSKGEAMVRVGGFFYNPTDAGDGESIKVISLMVNGNEVVENGPMLFNPRGYVRSVFAGGWFGVLEIEIPIEYLNDGDNTIYFQRQQNADFTTVMLQVWDMDQEPGRTDDNNTALTSVALGSDSVSLMNGRNLGIVATFIPENASNKALVWTSSDPSVATVDENGIVTATADSGVTIITATSEVSSSIFATKTITAIPFESTEVTSIEILEGMQITVDQYVNTPLTLQTTPQAESVPEIEWTSNDESIVSVLPSGKVIGKVVGGSATITARVKGTNISDEIDVNVRIAGDESISTRLLPDFLRPFISGTFSVPVTAMGDRTLIVEFLKGTTILGAGVKEISVVGSQNIDIEYLWSTAPSPDTGYSIRITLKDGDDVLAVQSKVVEIIDHVRVNSIDINEGLPTVQVGKTITRSASILPEDAFDISINWTSSNPEIATVNETTGVITGVAQGVTTIKATSNDVNTIFDEVIIEVQSGVVVIPLEGIVIPSSKNVFPGNSVTLIPILTPSFTTETEITWFSSNNAIVSVNENGVLTAGTTEGNAIITAASVANPSITTTCEVSVSTSIVIEAETFVNTGGSSDGVIKSSVGFNNNTSGDWAEYTVDIPTTGTYSLKYNIASPNNTGLGVNTYVDGILLNTTNVSGTTGWEIYAIQSGSDDITIDEGTHTIRFESTGEQTWQWNADWFSLTLTSSLSVNSLEGKSNFAIYPNPTQGNFTIETSRLDKETKISIMSIAGVTLQQITNSSQSILHFDISEYPTGLYLIKIETSTSTDIYKLVKK